MVGASEEGGAQERLERDDTTEVVGTKGASEEGGAQERLGEDDTIELWEEDDTREG